MLRCKGIDSPFGMIGDGMAWLTSEHRIGTPIISFLTILSELI